MKPVNANWVATGAGYYAEDRQWVIFMAGPDDQSWVVPTDQATVYTLWAAGMPSQTE